MTISDIRKALDAVRDYVLGDSQALGLSEAEIERLLHIRSHEDLVLFNYSTAAQYIEHWPDVLRVCRGVVFDRQGNLVSFPFHKFFNLNEHDETRPMAVKDWDIWSVSEKADGVLIQVFKHNDQLVFASRHGFWTPPSRLAQQLAGDLIHKVVELIPFPNWTLMMELIHRDVWQPGMVHPGDRQELVLLAVRDLSTLELIPAISIFPMLAGRPDGPFRLPLQYLVRTLDDVVETVHRVSTPDWEGVVLQGRGDLGNQLVKIKSPLYVHRLALLRGLSPRRVLEAYEKDGWLGINNLLSGIEEIVLQYPEFQDLTRLIDDAENGVREEASQYLHVSREQIQQVPVEWRWVVGYRDNEVKFDSAVRKIVRRRIENRLKGEA